MQLTGRDRQVLSFLFDEKQHVAAQEEHLNPSKLEIEAVALAEAGNLEAALLKIDEAINQAPNHPSPLNNKAQILRLMQRDAEAMQVLDACLSAPCPSAPSHEQHSASASSSIRRRALAQRGWLHFRADRTAEAFRDFDEAGKLGCAESRRMAVRCNPYAQMCNDVLINLLSPTANASNNNNKQYSV